MQFARNCHRKTLLSLLLDMALRCPHARRISSRPLSTPSTDLGEDISDRVGGRQHLSVWLGMVRHQQVGIHGYFRRTLASISSSESYAIPDRGHHLHLTARSSHNLICRRVEPGPVKGSYVSSSYHWCRMDSGRSRSCIDNSTRLVTLGELVSNE
jgi:hypothetical protein